MPETVTICAPPAAEGATAVSASALALHLDCSRAYVGKLKAEGVIRRQADCFLLDQSRVAYLRFLRAEHRDHRVRRLMPRTSYRRHADRIVEPPSLVRAAWWSCDPAQHRAVCV